MVLSVFMILFYTLFCFVFQLSTVSRWCGCCYERTVVGVGFRVAVSALGTGCQSLLDVNLVSLRVNVPWVGQCVIGGWDKGGCAFDDGVR